MAHTTLAENFRTMDYGAAPEDPAQALAWLDQFKGRFGHFIGGTWTAPVEGRYFETCDPSTGEKIADIAQGSGSDVDVAVKAARAALPRWPFNKTFALCWTSLTSRRAKASKSKWPP